MSTRTRIVAAIVSGLILAMCFGVSIATASKLPASGASHPTKEFPHCAQQVASNGGRSGPVQCFRTFADAIAVSTGDLRYVGKSEAQVVAALEHPSVLGGSVTPSASILLGTDWWDVNFGGATWNWYGTGGRCDSNTYYQFDHAPSGWNDEISSARAWQGSSSCNHYYHYENSYENRYVNGAVIDCGFCSSMGVMGDETSSEKLTA